MWLRVLRQAVGCPGGCVSAWAGAAVRHVPRSYDELSQAERVALLRPEQRDHVWAYDFVMCRTHDGRPVRMLTIVDEYTRECLAIDVARRLNSDDVLERLAWLFATRNVPKYLRSDNGPEFTTRAVRKWLNRLGVKTLFIVPGSPWENGYIESFNGKMRDELLSRENFTTLQEAKVLIEQWRMEYNQVRPHSALGYRPPAPEAILAAITT